MKSLISFVAFVITAAEFTYWLGRRSRHAIDSANDTLAALWAVSWGVGEDQHYELVSEAIDVLIAAFAPKPSLTPLAVIAAPTSNPVAEPTSAKPRNSRSARRRRATKKNQD